MLIDVNKWIDKNGSFDEAGGLDLVRHGYEWIRRMRKFENKADRHTFIGLIMKMRYVRSFIIISMKIDSIMRMGMCMLNH